MDVVLLEGIGAILRWLHVIAGIAWIGSSFYFIHLDLSLKPRPESKDRDSDGEPQREAWQVHGGGFYNMVKYVVAPARLPAELTWFKWEAYVTWLSGMALLAVVYYLGASLFLIDATVLDLTQGEAVAISLAGLLVPWLAYEGLCRSPLGRHELALSLLGYAFLIALTYGFVHVFGGRGAFVQIGALIGTIMVANVFVVIIPNQKKIVADLIASRVPDAALGEQGKQRSVHNNYLTLPVVFLMVSNHYPLFFATQYNWLIVAIVLMVGPLIRHFFNSRHAGKGSPWWTWIAAALGMAAVLWLSMAGPRLTEESAVPPATVSLAEAEDVILTRCSMCHAQAPVWDGIPAPPKGVRLDSPAEIAQHAHLIELQAVRSNAMPPGNVTMMTAEERGILAAWLASR